MNSTTVRLGAIVSGFILILACACFQRIYAQDQTVFELLKSDRNQADHYYKQKNYRLALQFYNKVRQDLPVREQTARCQFFLRQYSESIRTFIELKSQRKLKAEDLLLLSEAYAATQAYDQSAQVWREYLEAEPDNTLALAKLWRLRNLQYLFEDSIHFNVSRVEINSTSSDMCPVAYENGIIFLSNRKPVSPVQLTDATTNADFYRLYYSKMTLDSTVTPEVLRFEPPAEFKPGEKRNYHFGPLCLYSNSQRMAYTSTGTKRNEKSLKLYFAERKEGRWVMTGTFPYNSENYSIHAAAVSEDGSTLYFSSNMPGTLGGKDLFVSRMESGRRTKPENLGERINTPLDETFPFLVSNKLYFASSGHPGLGALDIYKTEIDENGFGEVTNLGFPINTHYDDFGITLNREGTHGFFSSNRGDATQLNDDIYELDIDLQTYPITIAGVLQFKESSWQDETNLHTLNFAQLELMDNIRKVTVAKATSNHQGEFSLAIPYHSQYVLKVINQLNEELTVSLDLSRKRGVNNQYHIVVVRDLFKAAMK